jgi:hypothetical protein
VRIFIQKVEMNSIFVYLILGILSFSYAAQSPRDSGDLENTFSSELKKEKLITHSFAPDLVFAPYIVLIYYFNFLGIDRIYYR